MTLNESGTQQAYRAIKRRFFFEHKDGANLLALVPTDEQEFQETLRSGEEATAAVVRDLVLALNRFFEPDCADTDKDHVQLWQSHRYDVRAPSTFVSFRALVPAPAYRAAQDGALGRGVAALRAGRPPQLRLGRHLGEQ